MAVFVILVAGAAAVWTGAVDLRGGGASNCAVCTSMPMSTTVPVVVATSVPVPMFVDCRPPVAAWVLTDKHTNRPSELSLSISSPSSSPASSPSASPRPSSDQNSEPKPRPEETDAPLSVSSDISTDGMVWVPPGEFVMGTDDAHGMPNEHPARRVRVDGFWMDRTPVTNAEFRRFVEATGYITTAERPIDWEELKKQLPPGTPKPSDDDLRPGSLVFTPPEGAVDQRDLGGWWAWTVGADWQHPEGLSSTIEGRDDHPVVQVSWDDAAAYAEWAHKRLPTEAEWEYASRGGSEKTRYWWGDDFLKDGKYMANTFTGRFPYDNTKADGYERTSPVKAFSPNPYGLYDMAGNVWNWCADLYRADAHAMAKKASAGAGGGEGCCFNPAGPADTFDPTRDVPRNPERVIKGGSFLCHPSYCESYRPTARRGTPPDTGSSHVGFRCVYSSEGEADAPDK